MNEIRTSSSKVTPSYGAFDDYIIIESIDANERIQIRLEEFEFQASQLFENWQKKESKYIQLLKEWNECIGLESVDEKPSILLDVSDTIDALKLIEGVDAAAADYGTLTKNDLKLLLDFFTRNQHHKLKIWKEQ